MAGDLGLSGVDVPVAYGGEGMDKISSCVVTEVMGGAGSFSVSFSAHTGIGTLPIVYFGTEAQKQKYLPKLASGEHCGAYCLTEPNAGSDALNSQTTAHLTDDGRYFLLNGEKIYITNGGWADLFVVYAKVDGEQFTGFIVERDSPGLTVGPEEKKMGINGSSTTAVVFKDCRVPVENVLYAVGKGHIIAFNILNLGRYKLGTNVMGSSKVVLAEAVRYANARVQFGKKISSFGMIKMKLAEMSTRIFMAESLAYRLAGMLEDRFAVMSPEARQQSSENARAIEEYAVECSISKVFGSECLDYCVDELVQIFGGNGYSAEYPVERMYRDARINRIFEGTNEINRLLIPGTLLKRAMKGRLALLEAIGSLTEDIDTLAPAPGERDAPLALQTQLVKRAKQILLLAAGRAVNKLLERLAHEQEILCLLADMSMDIFAMESGLLRARKHARAKGPIAAQYHLAAVRIYVDDALPKIIRRAQQVLAHVESGDDLKSQLAAVDTLAAAYAPIDSIALQRVIADRVIKTNRYPF